VLEQPETSGSSEALTKLVSEEVEASAISDAGWVGEPIVRSKKSLIVKGYGHIDRSFRRNLKK
jgi:hypothetical protein